MDAASRAALRKRKMQLKARASPVSMSGIDEARAATRERLAQLLDERTDLAAAIEEALFASLHAVSPKYRSRFRQIYVALRNDATGFRARLCNGDLDPRDFAVKPLDELKPLELKQSEKEIHDKNIKQSVAQKLLPENIDQIKDGRDREKWGVSRSAAAID